MPLRLMVVEDDESLVELLRYNFVAAGYAVETVMHGDEASTRRHEEMGFHDGWGKALEQLVAVAKKM